MTAIYWSPINDTSHAELHKLRSGPNGQCRDQQVWDELLTVENADEVENSPIRTRPFQVLTGVCCRVLESWVSRGSEVLCLSKGQCVKCMLQQPNTYSFIQTQPSSWPTHLCIGVWLRAGLTNALTQLICGTASTPPLLFNRDTLTLDSSKHVHVRKFKLQTKIWTWS